MEDELHLHQNVPFYLVVAEGPASALQMISLCRIIPHEQERQMYFLVSYSVLSYVFETMHRCLKGYSAEYYCRDHQHQESAVADLTICGLHLRVSHLWEEQVGLYERVCEVNKGLWKLMLQEYR